MTVVEAQASQGQKDEGLATRLKAATHGTHDRLDKKIMSFEPFASVENYGRFLQVQYRFHSAIDPLYHSDELASRLPDLEGRRRTDLVRQDLIDTDTPVPTDIPSSCDPSDMPAAFGWLYVAEGSNLGAAFLLKAAKAMGLSEEKGARHLAGAPEGRGLHWRTFQAALDEANFSEEEKQRAIAAATEAFNLVYGMVLESYEAA